MAKETDVWKQVDQLVGEQKFQAAVDLLDAELKRAKTAGDEPDWLRALLKDTQLRVGLGGYETAVRFLKEQPWRRFQSWRAPSTSWCGVQLAVRWRSRRRQGS